VSAPGARAAPQISASSRPKLPRGVRLQFDRAREAWVILAPERVLFPDEIAVEILRRCDGAADVDTIAGQLAAQFDAELPTVRADVIELLADLAQKGFVQA
jgi:pyrroloquinoline quinone biosynthesis protein D